MIKALVGDNAGGYLNLLTLNGGVAEWEGRGRSSICLSK